MAVMSLMGFYNYDETLLDGLIENLPNKNGIPADYPDSYYTDVTIDSDTVVENLLVECAEFEILYADFNALKRIIKIWSAKEKPVWQKMFNTVCYKYNPIWNKDGKTTWTESQTGTGNKTETETGTKTGKGSSSITDDFTSATETTNKTTGNGSSTRSGTDETTGKVSAYNSTDFQNREQSNSTSNETNNSESTENFTGTGTVTNKGEKINNSSSDETSNVSRETKDSNNGTTTHEQNDTGNIGVTMTQQMITAEREIAVFNIIDFIINDFKERFCLRIY
nr:MAG TPA: Portal protein, Proximal tail tube, phi29, mature virion, VIRUS.3A [Caudoviricetes sp.]